MYVLFLHNGHAGTAVGRIRRLKKKIRGLPHPSVGDQVRIGGNSYYVRVVQHRIDKRVMEVHVDWGSGDDLDWKRLLRDTKKDKAWKRFKRRKNKK